MGDDNKIDQCVYCGCIADTRDHVIPWSYNNSGKRKREFIDQEDNTDK